MITTTGWVVLMYPIRGISYYQPSNFRCQRTWLPIFLQLLSIIRNNGFIVYREFFGKKALSHKTFTLEMIDWLMSKAKFYDNKISNTMIRSFENSERNQTNDSSTSRRVLSAPRKKKRKDLYVDELLTYNFQLAS